MTYVRLRSIINSDKQRGVREIKYSELEKMLKKAGCYKYREGANHTVWYSPITGNLFTVGRHRSEDVKTGTLNSILKEAGLK